MKDAQNHDQAEDGKRRYAKPEIKKREQLKEITESPAPAVTGAA